MVRKVKRIKIVVGKFGMTPQELEVGEGTTVGQALEKSDITLNSGEKPYVGGEQAVMEDVLEDGDVVNVVGLKEGGR